MIFGWMKRGKNQAAKSPCTALNRALYETYPPPPTHPKDARDRFNIPVLLNVERPHSVFTCWTVPLLAKLQPEYAIARQMQQCSIHRIMGWRNPVLQMLAEYGQRETPPVNSRCSYSTRKNNSIGKKRVWFSVIFFLFFFAWEGGGSSRGGVKKFMRHGGRTVWSSRCAVETNSGSSSPPRRKQSPEMGWCEFIVYCFCL